MENTWVRTSSVQETRPRVATLLEGTLRSTPPPSRKDRRNRRVGYMGTAGCRQPSEMASPKKHLGEAGLSLAPPQWG